MMALDEIFESEAGYSTWLSKLEACQLTGEVYLGLGFTGLFLV